MADSSSYPREQRGPQDGSGREAELRAALKASRSSRSEGDRLGSGADVHRHDGSIRGSQRRHRSRSRSRSRGDSREQERNHDRRDRSRRDRHADDRSGREEERRRHERHRDDRDRHTERESRGAGSDDPRERESRRRRDESDRHSRHRKRRHHSQSRSRSRSPTNTRKHRSPSNDSRSSDNGSSASESSRSRRGGGHKSRDHGNRDERERRERRDRRRRKEEKKERRERKEKKKRKKEAAKSGEVIEWGKHGIISETDVIGRLTGEYRQWLVEERHINPETISKPVEKKEIARFIESYNTATMPDPKYYDLEKHERHMSMIRSGETLPVGGYDFLSDEKAASASAAARRKEEEAKRNTGRDAWQSKEQLEELRRIQNERIQAGKMKQLGLETSANMGVRMEGRLPGRK